jgi:hypothetical protein
LRAPLYLTSIFNEYFDSFGVIWLSTAKPMAETAIGQWSSPPPDQRPDRSLSRLKSADHRTTFKCEFLHHHKTYTLATLDMMSRDSFELMINK